MRPLFHPTSFDTAPDAGVADIPAPNTPTPTLLGRLKRTLGIDTAQSRYAYGDDPRFGYTAESRIADSWTKTTCGYCSVGCGMLIGTKEGKPVARAATPIIL